MYLNVQYSAYSDFSLITNTLVGPDLSFVNTDCLWQMFGYTKPFCRYLWPKYQRPKLIGYKESMMWNKRNEGLHFQFYGDYYGIKYVSITEIERWTVSYSLVNVTLICIITQKCLWISDISNFGYVWQIISRPVPINSLHYTVNVSYNILCIFANILEIIIFVLSFHKYSFNSSLVFCWLYVSHDNTFKRTTDVQHIYFIHIYLRIHGMLSRQQNHHLRRTTNVTHTGGWRAITRRLQKNWWRHIINRPWPLITAQRKPIPRALRVDMWARFVTKTVGDFIACLACNKNGGLATRSSLMTYWSRKALVRKLLARLFLQIIDVLKADPAFCRNSCCTKETSNVRPEHRSKRFVTWNVEGEWLIFLSII